MKAMGNNTVLFCGQKTFSKKAQTAPWLLAGLAWPRPCCPVHTGPSAALTWLVREGTGVLNHTTACVWELLPGVSTATTTFGKNLVLSTKLKMHKSFNPTYSLHGVPTLIRAALL